MLEEILKYNSFASKDELKFLLFEALPLSNRQKISDLKKYCTSNSFSIGRCFDATLKLLEFMSLIIVPDGVVTINNEFFNPATIKRHEEYLEQGDFIKNLFLSLRRENAIQLFLQPIAIRQDAIRRLFYVRENLIPFQFYGIRNLLISLGFFERYSTLGSSDLFVRADSTELFETLVINPLREEKQSQKRSPLSGLKSRQERNEELGEQAEIFVLEFEKRRLKGHPSIHSVRRVSEEYSSAGFDIESFNDIESVFLDRFIEVKSYSESPLFYWSRNEIERAKELTDQYFLYLVDRSKMAQPDYVPKIFQDPFQKVFQNEYWEKETEVWKINPSRENPA